MKILMLTPYLPYPPSSGGQVRSYNLIKHLSKRHEIYLVSLIKSKSEKKYQENLKPYCKEIHVCKRSESPWTVSNILKSVFGRHPFLVVRNYSSEARHVVENLLKDNTFDLIHAETFYIMPHIPSTKIPILLVEQTIEYRVYQHYVQQLRFKPIRPFFYFDIIKLRYWEKTYWKRANLVGAVSEEDEMKMHELLPELSTAVIPNAAGEDLLNVFKSKKKVEPIFLYQGNFSWLQNVEAAQILIKHIFPHIKKQIPHAQCIIAGQRAQHKLGNIEQDGIEIVDIPPSSISQVIEVYSRASIFIAPIEGPGGTRLKILAAMAAGLPIVSSPTGVSGLAVTENENVLIAKSNKEFVSKSVNLLANNKKYDQIRVNARKLIDDTYSWNSVSQKLEEVYRQLKQDNYENRN